MAIDDPRIDRILALARSDRATDRSRTSIRLAVEAADEFSDACVDSCHILCGLLREGQGVASHILRSQFNLSRDSLDVAMQSRPSVELDGTSDLAPELKTVMTVTLDFAARLNHSYFGTEHLLVGVIAPGIQSSALLDRLGISGDRIEEEVLGLLGHLP